MAPVSKLLMAGYLQTPDSARARSATALRGIGRAPENLSAILITHEYADRIAGNF